VDAANISLDGWDIVSADQADWVPWTGAAGEARAKILGSADGYTVVSSKRKRDTWARTMNTRTPSSTMSWTARFATRARQCRLETVMRRHQVRRIRISRRSPAPRTS
jgi:hypothetical protein